MGNHALESAAAQLGLPTLVVGGSTKVSERRRHCGERIRLSSLLLLLQLLLALLLLQLPLLFKQLLLNLLLKLLLLLLLHLHY